MPNRRTRRALIVALVLALAAPAAAGAHVGDTGPTQTITQSVGPYELSVTIELPAAVPAPLFVSIAAREDLQGATLSLRAAPRGRSLADAPAVTTAAIPGTPVVYKAELAVDRPGDWELEVAADGPGGSGSAVIPFTLTAAPLPPYTVPLVASLGGLFVLLLAGVLVAASAQSRARPAPRRATWALGQLAFGFGVAAAIFGGQQIYAGFQAAAAVAPTYGRPHVNLVLRSDPAEPAAGRPISLTLELSDGGTGLPVDDLAPHHEALVHLVVIDETGAFFAHLHPARVAPGRFVAALTPDRPGRYTAYLELARHQSGTQVVARDFVVGGEAAAPAPDPPGLGPRDVGGVQVEVSASAEPLRAGRQAVLTFRMAEGGRPVLDLQPWLGMAGHLIARSADGEVFSHVHANALAAPPGPQGQGMRYGPDIEFVYTFPEPGRYRVWAQFQRGGAILTVPLLLEVLE